MASDGSEAKRDRVRRRWTVGVVVATVLLGAGALAVRAALPVRLVEPRALEPVVVGRSDDGSWWLAVLHCADDPVRAVVLDRGRAGPVLLDLEAIEDVDDAPIERSPDLGGRPPSALTVPVPPSVARRLGLDRGAGAPVPAAGALEVTARFARRDAATLRVDPDAVRPGRAVTGDAGTVAADRSAPSDLPTGLLVC